MHLAGSFVVLALATVVTDSVSGESIAVLVGAVVVAAAAAGVLVAAGWAARRTSLLLWPVVVCAAIGALDAVAPTVSDLLMGLVVLSFLFVGLSQPPHRGLWFVAPAAVLFVRVIDLEPRQIAVRLPIAAVVWIICSEVPARLIQELRRKNAALELLASTDSLTGLLNRSRLDIHLEVAGAHSAVALIDLDHFKDFNDGQGHVAGDVVLMDFAAVLQGHSRPEDAVFRYGGEEFLIVLADTSPAEAAEVLQRVRAAWSAHGSGPTFSAGVTFGGVTAVHRADTLLYAAKAQGRDRVVVDTGRAEPVSV